MQHMLRTAGFAGTLEEWHGTAAAERDEVLTAFERTQQVRYLSLLRLVLRSGEPDPDEVPSVFHLLSTARALELHDADGGPEAVIDRHGLMARRVREGLADAGLRELAHAPFQSDSVTPALVPEGITASDLRKALERQYGIAIAGAQGDYWKREMVRIGHFGFVYLSDVARCLRALRVVHRERRSAEASPPLVV